MALTQGWNALERAPVHCNSNYYLSPSPKCCLQWSGTRSIAFHRVPDVPADPYQHGHPCLRRYFPPPPTDSLWFDGGTIRPTIEKPRPSMRRWRTPAHSPAIHPTNLLLNTGIEGQECRRY
jgi:hypothetical protein